MELQILESDAGGNDPRLPGPRGKVEFSRRRCIGETVPVNQDRGLYLSHPRHVHEWVTVVCLECTAAEPERL